MYLGAGEKPARRTERTTLKEGSSLDNQPKPRDEGAREPIIVYCLETECKRTTYHGIDDWSEDEHRHMLVHTGRAPSMMAPFCDQHRAKKQPAA